MMAHVYRQSMAEEDTQSACIERMVESFYNHLYQLHDTGDDGDEDAMKLRSVEVNTQNAIGAEHTMVLTGNLQAR